MNRYLMIGALASLLPLAGIARTAAQGGSPAQQVLAAAAAEQKYTFLVFVKDNGPATQAMAQMVKRGVESRNDRAALAFVNVASPAEKAVVDRFAVSRAPMPLTIAVAPNGAITSLSTKNITDEQIAKAFVSPAAAQCIKSMQDGRLVLACVQSSAQNVPPQGVKDFCDDPQFKHRAAVTFISANDPAEASFLKQLEFDPQTQAAMTVFLAPPGVMVGKFAPTATKEQLAAALHKAGHCCDDPNCKHAQPSSQASRPTTGASRPANSAPNARRN